jgi:hypothetical protein
MTWSPTRYGQFPDEATARQVAVQLGAEFPEDGSIPTGNANYALKAPIVEWVRRPGGTKEAPDPGEAMPGYWAMMRFNLDTPEGAAADAAFCATPYHVELANPSNVFL